MGRWRTNLTDYDKEIVSSLIKEEKAEAGNIKWNVYKQYLKSLGAVILITSILLNVLFHVLSVGGDVWLSIWVSHTQVIEKHEMKKESMYLGVLAAFGFVKVVVIFLKTYTLFSGALKASVRLHNLFLLRILRAPMSFFDTTPLGRVINRFTTDISVLDINLPRYMNFTLDHAFTLISTFAVISYSTPSFIISIFPITVIYYFVQRYYIATFRQLVRLEAISKSSIFSHFTESITGSSSIRAYGAVSRFIKESDENVDFNLKCLIPSTIADRWLGARLEIVANIIIFLSALFVVLDEGIDPGLAGLSISYALEITVSLNNFVLVAADVESNIISAERINEYIGIQQEAPWTITPNIAPEDWPATGIVEFRDYQTRYRDGMELVLKGISLKIYSQEKVGIVGRTGAGKSSLTLSLFRIIEACGGTIYIDGIDVSKLGLHALRSKITIIPQDPVLFTGSLRLNLDPFGIYSDDQLWKSLELAHLKSFVINLPGKLLYEVSDDGGNLSVGQRQLICLARALLRKTKLLVLDEATASVDIQTDDLIQKTIKTEFSSCTILTIAHRINTIMDSDRVLVLNYGLVVEFDKPDILLKNRSSIFFGMAKDAGLAH